MDIDEYGEKAKQELEELPEELRTAVGHLAWERGHSSGYDEVLTELSDLVYGLKAPLAAFEKRMGGDKTMNKRFDSYAFCIDTDRWAASIMAHMARCHSYHINTLESGSWIWFEEEVK